MLDLLAAEVRPSAGVGYGSAWRRASRAVRRRSSLTGPSAPRLRMRSSTWSRRRDSL